MGRQGARLAVQGWPAKLIMLYFPAVCHGLSQGLEQFGVGQWREISDTLLPQWDETSLRIKAARLMGSQSLARYVGWKGDRHATTACVPMYKHTCAQSMYSM